MAGSGAGGGIGGIGGQQQIINGQSYTMYSQPWYDAQAADKVRQAKLEGTASGTAAGAADAAKYTTKYPGYQTPPPPTPGNFQSILSGLSGAGGGSGDSSGLLPSVIGGGGGGIGTTGGPGGTGGGGGYAQLQAPDTTAATSAAFNRAKDTVGQTSRGALTGLAGAMAGRGIVGSGVEGRGQASVVNQGQQQLGDTVRQSAITQADLAQKNAELSYTGGITQRGQDINQNEDYQHNLLTQRGQDVQQRNNEAQLALSRQDFALKALAAMNNQQSLVY